MSEKWYLLPVANVAVYDLQWLVNYIKAVIDHTDHCDKNNHNPEQLASYL